MTIEDRSSHPAGNNPLLGQYLRRETQFQLINLEAYKYLNEHKRPTGNSFYALEGLVEAWINGDDVKAFDFYQQNYQDMELSLEFIAEHSRGQQLHRIFRQLSSAIKPKNTSDKYIDLHIVKKMRTKNIPHQGIEDIFTFMSPEYRDALLKGAIMGNYDAISLLQLDSLPLLEHTSEMVVNRARKIERQPDGSTSYQLPTRVHGVYLEFRYPQGKGALDLLFVVSPLGQNPTSPE